MASSGQPAPAGRSGAPGKAAAQKRALTGPPGRGVAQQSAGKRAKNAGAAAAAPPVDSDVTIRVNSLQKGNPLLNYLTNMPWAYDSKIEADYVVGRSACVLFLSVKYHMLHPKYLLTRMGRLRTKFTSRILLCQVDRANDEPLQDISRLAFVNGWSLLCAPSAHECARYVETLKSFEAKSADSLKKKVDKYDNDKIFASIMTTIRSVNNRDVGTLATNFKTCKNVMQASVERLAVCSGLGPKKVRRIHQAFRQPFRAKKK